MSVGETSGPHSGLAASISSLMRPVADRVIHWRKSIASAGFALCAAIVAAALFAPTINAPVAVQTCSPRRRVSLHRTGARPARNALLSLSSDSMSHPDASRLHLFEDGRPLGPAHSLHDAVRELGGGRFLHWGTAAVVFDVGRD